MYRGFSNSSSSPQSYVSAKVRSSSHSQPISPWSDYAVDPSSPYAQPLQPTPWAPYMSPRPLPQSSPSHSSHLAPHGSFPMPTSPPSSSPSLHPILEFDRSGRLIFNITRPLQKMKFKQNTAVNPDEPAVWPLTAQLYITIPGCPDWSFKVVNPTGVTLHDVLSRIFQEFQRSVPRQEFITFAQQMQDAASSAFYTRTNGNPAEHSLGAKRVDFLGHKTFFIGLCRAADGSDAWDVKFASAVA